MAEDVQSLDIRDIAIINSFPLVQFDNILNVGCGRGKLDYHLSLLGLDILSTDIKEQDLVSDILKFSKADIYDLESFPVKEADIVICSETLEHLDDYAKALFNLIKLTKQRLIITVPYKTSFFTTEHVNFWDDDISEGHQDIQDFIDLCTPYSISISKIITKIKDIEMFQRCYLIIIDKTQIG